MSSIVWCDNTVGKVFGETLTKMSNVTFASFQISFTRELVIFTWEKKTLPWKQKNHISGIFSTRDGLHSQWNANVHVYLNFHTWRQNMARDQSRYELELQHVDIKWTGHSHMWSAFFHIFDENVRPRDLNLLMLITYIDVWSAVFTLRKFNINLSVLSHIYRSDVRKNSLGWETISCLSPSWASGE